MNYVSRTNCNLNEISTAALKVRVNGFKSTMEAIEKSAKSQVDIGRDVVRKNTRNLIASLNYPMNMARKELIRRGVKL